MTQYIFNVCAFSGEAPSRVFSDLLAKYDEVFVACDILENEFANGKVHMFVWTPLPTVMQGVRKWYHFFNS
jgi:hypothetical protein